VCYDDGACADSTLASRVDPINLSTLATPSGLEQHCKFVRLFGFQAKFTMKVSNVSSYCYIDIEHAILV